MDRIAFLFLLSLLYFNVFSQGQISRPKTLNEISSKKEIKNQKKNKIVISGKMNGFDYVDLGLPSGTKWASYSVGATSPFEDGKKYLWSETEERDDWAMNPRYKEKPNFDIQGTSYDVATKKWGKPWVIPSKEQIEELINYCKWYFILIDELEKENIPYYFKDDIHSLYVIEGPNGNCIYFPSTSFEYEKMVSSTPVPESVRSSSVYRKFFNDGDDVHKSIFNEKKNKKKITMAPKTIPFQVRPVFNN